MASFTDACSEDRAGISHQYSVGLNVRQHLDQQRLSLVTILYNLVCQEYFVSFVFTFCSSFYSVLGHSFMFAFSALMLLVERQEVQPMCKTSMSDGGQRKWAGHIPEHFVGNPICLHQRRNRLNQVYRGNCC